MLHPSVAALAWLVLLPTSPVDGDAAHPTDVLELAPTPVQRVELSANTFTWSSQDAVAVAQAPSGRTVLVWQSRRQQEGNYGVYARLFDPSGQPLSGEVEVNQYVLGPQTSPAVALDAKGSAWFAWESLGQDGDGGGIFARRFDADLETATVEVLVNDETAGHQAEVALACDAQGRALIAWTSPDGAKGERAVLARLLGSDGTPLGDSIRVGAGGRATLPAITAHRDGTWTIAWSSHDVAHGRPQAIRARLLAADGTPLCATQALFESEGLQPVEPVLSTGVDGELIAAWLVADGEDYVPHAARFRLDDETGGWSEIAQLRLPDEGRGYTSGLDVAALEDGRYVLAWTRFVHGADADLWARVVSAADEPGAPVALSRAREGDQRLAVGGGARRLVAAADGRLALAWSGDAGLGDGSAANLTLLVPADLVGDNVAASASTLRFDPDPGALPHEPPVSSGGAMRREDFLGTKSLSGPDFGFLAITQTSLTPPDPHMAAGPDHVVEIVNGAIAWFLRDGTFQHQEPIDGGNGFWASAGASGFIFDPEVLFDPDSRRFMAMANERAGGAYFLFAVSDDDDPNGTWHKYRFNVTAAAGDTDIDSPNMGVDDTAVYLSADFFGPDKYLVYIVEKAPLLTGGTPQTRSLLHTGSQSWGIPVMYTAAPAFYMVEAFETLTSSKLRLHAITDPLGTPSDTTFDLTVPLYSIPEDPPQLGTSARPELFEARFWSCVFRDGKLYATHHQGSQRALQRWYEIDMASWPQSGTPTLVQSGDVDPGPGLRSFFGSIGVDGQGNVGLCYARSGTSEFISMARSWHAAGAPAGTTTASVVIKASTAPDTSGRWGDYSATVADPDVDGAFWGTHEFREGGWGTWVGLFGPCDPPVSYCTAKVNSLGLTPAIGSTGEPSVGTNSLALTVSNAVPNANAIFFYGNAPQAAPAFNAFLCVLPPLLRSAPQVIGAGGSLSLLVPVTLDLLGRTRFYQCWYRDPAHPDGTGVGLSDGLEVTFCP